MRTIQIDLGAIADNYRKLKDLTDTKLMAVVKADAFGHGIIEVSKKLEAINVDMLATADIDEALEIREAGIKSPLVAWLHGSTSDFAAALQNNIELGVSNLNELEKIASAAKTTGKIAKLHFKIDTGLGRNGSSMKLWPELISRAVELEKQNLIEFSGVFSHLSGTSQADDENQLAIFQQAVEVAKELGASFKLRHIAASLAALNHKSMRLDMVRVGIALYGLDPDSNTRAAEFGLVPAMRVSSEVVSIKDVPEGHGVSYGYLHKTAGPSRLALVPFGYGEGLPRIATGKATVLVNGKRYKILPRIAMDQFVLDVGSDQIQVGDEVVIFGNSSKGEPTAEDLAQAAGTINYEIVTRIGGRAKRVFIQ